MSMCTLGAQFRFDDNCLWSVAFACDTKPADDDKRTPDLLVDRQYRIATGIQYDWKESLTISAAYQYLDAGDADINQEGGPL